jgi:hypothetical protein
MGSQLSRLEITPIGAFLIFLDKDALTNLPITCTIKDRRGTRHGFVESDLIGLHNSVSFKVKYTICMRVRSITKKYAIGRPGFEFVQITLFQNEALASKRSKVAYLGVVIRIATHKKSSS